MGFNIVMYRHRKLVAFDQRQAIIGDGRLERREMPSHFQTKYKVEDRDHLLH
uniref:Uncharacterized protein n=1 Tax=Arion vulgaris TaxID=1028688 RepID=A0A0B6XVX2_9EUPU